MGMIGNTLAQGLISGANIVDGTVDTPDIKDSAVTAAKIATGVVTPGKLSTGAPTWDSTGRLGIGTASPTTDLSITNSSGPVVRLVRTSNRFELSADTDFMSLNARDASTYITFRTADTERVRLDASGNLLVGTTSSTARLTVESSAALLASFNGTATNGGYMTWRSSGTTIADLGTTDQCFGNGSGNDNFAINARGLRYLAFGTNNTERARITSSGNLSLGSTADNGPRLSVDGNSLSVSGVLYRFGDQYTHKMGGYNSQANNNGRTLFAYAYDQANWNYQYIKVIVKRGYYYESGYAEYMINCQNNSVTQVSNTNTSTSTSSFTLSHNTVNSNRKITTVSFVSPSSYHTWDFEIEFWGMAPVSWTSTPANGQIALG